MRDADDDGGLRARSRPCTFLRTDAHDDRRRENTHA